jgi:indoleamine 2,3-dioxygenase
VVPPSISIPFLAVCQILELPPVATYAAVVLWNFKPLFSAERLDRLENLTTIMTFTGAVDESWFYLISVAIEARGGQLISVVLETIRCVRVKDTLSVINHLRQLLAGLEELPALLQRMYERCDPHFFYHRLRPFLAGSKNVSRAGLPHGVVFDDGSGRLQSVQYSGGSNAQSSLIQFFDIALGITHQPTSPGATRPSKGDAVRPDVRDRTASEPKHGPFQPKEESNFIMDMRQYMPGPHRRFLDHLTCVANIREFVKANPGNEALSSSYNACITALVAFRNVHLQIVSRYVVLPSRKVLDRPKNTSTTTTTHHQGVVSLRRSGDDDDILGARSGAEALENLTGTGGTTLIPFLKQVRDETRQCVRRRRPGAAMAIERNTDIRQAMSMQ